MILQETMYPYTLKYKDKIVTLLWVDSSELNYFKMVDDTTIYSASSVEDAKNKFAKLPFQINWSEASLMYFLIKLISY